MQAADVVVHAFQSTSTKVEVWGRSGVWVPVRLDDVEIYMGRN
jgi:hypothetical protein